MKKITKILLILVFFSCSSGDDPITENIADPLPESSSFYKLVKIVELNLDNTIDETTELEYNSSGLLVRIVNQDSDGETTINKYFYNGNVLTSSSFDNGTGLQSNTEYIYENDLIATSILTELNATIANEYEYNSIRQLIFKEQFNDGVSCCKSTFMFNSQGNIVSKFQEFSGTTTFYEFDGKNNFALLIFDEAFLNIFEQGKNNITKRTNDSSSDITINQYDYNEKGYPTKMTIKVNGEIISFERYIYQDL